MGVIEDTYEDLDTDVSLEEFREAVEAKVEQMGGLADDETAAMLVAHQLDDGEVGGIADVEPKMDEAKFLAKITSIGDVRTFERDGEDEEDGRVLNAEVADETGSIRVTFWDQEAVNAAEELEVGTVLRIKGRPQEGYNGVEVSVDKAEVDEDEDVDVQVQDTYRVADLSMGVSDVSLVGTVLGTDEVRTFDRDDGSEGKVSNLLLGDETGRVRVTLWDGQADLAEEFDVDETVEVVDGYVRDRDGALELHVGDRGAVERVDETVEFVPDATPIEALEIGDTADVAGVIRSADPKRTFDRDDGSEGQVRNVRLQDETGDIRVAMWGEKADLDLGPGDEVLFTDAEIQDGWQDDIEASAGWQTTVIELEDGATTACGDAAGDSDGDATRSASRGGTQSRGLDAFESGGSADSEGETGTNAEADSGAAGASSKAAAAAGAGGETETTDVSEFTGVVVQAGSPVILDDGEETMSVDTDADVTLGEEITVSGTLRDGRLDADEVR